MANSEEAATKADVDAVVTSAKNELRQEIKASEEHVIETMRDMQTELQKAFYSFTSSQHTRVSQLETNESAVVARLGTLEARVLDLERKVNFPNHPAQ
jgi:hypothetical protein